MIPSVVADQLEQGLRDFLRYSFDATTPGFQGIIERFLDEPGAFVRGPYVSLKRPFLPASPEQGGPETLLGGLRPPFTPHRHQAEAWRRLGGRRKLSTLVATGTGSGKTECFLWPVLSHCLAERQAGRRGVKAVLIYPMNALATDQAGRLAREIWNHPALKGQVTAGLYIGEGGRGAGGQAEMTAQSVVTDRATMRVSPPDILLTNYKMLDYLLLRAEDQGLWQYNDADRLRFLVVDEIHTFDGAQGTDLACLIRRLKHRVEADHGSLCCVGTSATLGGGDDRAALRAYAEALFAEPFDEHSVIGETRFGLPEFLGGGPVLHHTEPDLADAAAELQSRVSWLRAQAKAWLGEDAPDPTEPDGTVALGACLRSHAGFRALMSTLDDAGGLLPLDALVSALGRGRSEWVQHPRAAREAVSGLLGLVSAARRRDAAGRLLPFLDVRLQLWTRELARMVASVELEPRFRFAADLDATGLQTHLPAIHCRECGGMGWATRRDRDTPAVLRTDLAAFYRDFFSDGEDSARIVFLFPAAAAERLAAPTKAERRFVEVARMVLLGPGESPRADDPEPPEGYLEVAVVQQVQRGTRDDKLRLSRDCPFCGARGSLTLVGFRAATLTSAAIDELFATPFNTDKKLLAFSDAVQDAAHRAGFFGARTWRSTLRTALCQFILQGGEGHTLETLPAAFAQEAKRRLGTLGFVCAFLPPSLDWLHDWEAVKRDGAVPGSGGLVHLIERRLAWEIEAEFGLQSGIGRSLPETLAAAVFVDGARLDRVAEALFERMRNEVPGLRTLERPALRGFLVGVLHHLRVRGGVHHAELPSIYVAKRGDAHWVFGDVRAGYMHLPGFRRTSRLPAFLTDRGGSPHFETWVGREADWYSRWSDRVLCPTATLRPSAGDVYAVALSGLVNEGLLRQTETDTGRVWGTPDGIWHVSGRVSAAVCEGCQQRWAIASDDMGAFEGLTCLTAACDGRLRVDLTPGADLFGRLYALGDVQRIFAAEHTALVPRDRREETERQFKARAGAVAPDASPEPWHVNLLSCTPTLEMGIDIGDLSSVFLCSVPRGQANYVQRVGRAGRRDGNALVMTLAAGRPHDLYFFARPEEMMAGAVRPPGVFLGAARVLERQLCAFALDRWVQADPKGNLLPRRIADVLNRLTTKGLADRHASGLAPYGPTRSAFGGLADGPFPASFLAFVDAQAASLLRDFDAMFVREDQLDEHVRAELAAFVHGVAETGGGDDRGDLGYRLLSLLTDEKKQRDALRERRTKVRRRLKALEAAPAKAQDWETERDALEDEIDALGNLIKDIDDKHTLEFLTDRGWLPNYAFPESAVTLRSVIWKRRAANAPESPTGRNRKYDSTTYEYQRAPALALAELAPAAEFYAEGRKVKIQQVDLSTGGIELWRVCGECNHAQREELTHDQPVCPACGHGEWADSGRKVQMVRLTQVFARTPDQESRIRDDADEREPRFFEKQMLVDVSGATADSAFRVDDDRLPFGFESWRQVTFREINFGKGGDLGPKLRIAGRESARGGFRLCAKCGTVQDRRPKEARHDLSCPHHGLKDTPAEDLVECLFLYREFSSEALRLLLPLDEIGDTGRRDAFVAALRMGLALHFRGRVDHLRATAYSEPVPESVQRRFHIVLYDTVPGGTSYLRQLVVAREGRIVLFDVLQAALDGLRRCACKADEDGCYRCIRAHSERGEPVSKLAAISLLEELVRGAGRVVPINSLAEIRLEGALQSQLEGRFIAALRARCKKLGDASKLEKKVVDGRPGYRLLAGAREWLVVPQVEVGPDEGVAVPTSIDFVLRPAVPGPNERPIAVLTDGFEYHHDRIGLDLAQRMALVDSGRWEVWSITWFDLDAVLGQRGTVTPTNLLGLSPSAVDLALSKAGLLALKGLTTESTFDQLWSTLARDTADPPPDWGKAARVLLMARLGEKPRFAQLAPPDFRAALSEVAPPALAHGLAALPAHVAVRGTTAGGLVEWLVAAAPGEKFHGVVVFDDHPERQADPEFRGAWNGLLRLFQALRHADELFFVTRARTPTDDGALTLLAESHFAPPGGWVDALGVGPECRALCLAVEAAGAGSPEVGYELVDARGRTWAEAEVYWDAPPVALLRRAQVDAARGPAPDGVTVVLADAADALDRLCAALGLIPENPTTGSVAL